MTSQKSTDDLEARIIQRKKLSERLETVRAELGRISKRPFEIQGSGMGLSIGDLRARVENYKGSKAKLDARQEALLAELENELKEKCGLLDRYNQERTSLEKEEAELEEALANFAYMCSEDELRGVHARLQEVQADIDEIQKAIAHQDEVIVESRAEEYDLPSLASAYQQALADMSMGKGSQKDLDKAEKALAEARAAKDAGEEIVRQAQQTQAGLRKRLTIAQQSADGLQGDMREAACQYLLTRASLASEEYSRTVKDLAERFSQMRALASLLDEISEGSFPQQITTFKERRFFVPGFSIGSASANAYPDGMVSFESVKLDHAISKEREKLQAIGVLIG